MKEGILQRCIVSSYYIKGSGEGWFRIGMQVGKYVGEKTSQELCQVEGNPHPPSPRYHTLPHFPYIVTIPKGKQLYLRCVISFLFNLFCVRTSCNPKCSVKCIIVHVN